MPMMSCNLGHNPLDFWEQPVQYGFALWVLRDNAMTNVPIAQCKLGYHCCNLSNSNYLSASSDPTLDQFHIFLSYVLCEGRIPALHCVALLRSDWDVKPFLLFHGGFLVGQEP